MTKLLTVLERVLFYINLFLVIVLNTFLRNLSKKKDIFKFIAGEVFRFRHEDGF